MLRVLRWDALLGLYCSHLQLSFISGTLGDRGRKTEHNAHGTLDYQNKTGCKIKTNKLDRSKQGNNRGDREVKNNLDKTDSHRRCWGQERGQIWLNNKSLTRNIDKTQRYEKELNSRLRNTELELK